MDSTLSRFQHLLCCTECSARIPVWSSGAITCDSCGHRYAINSGIPDLRPSKALRLPKVYENPDYRRWNENLANAQDYFYESRGIISYVQNAGHRAVQNLCIGRDFAVRLDLSCGDGAHYRYLSSPERSLGIDIHQGSLEKLKRRYPDFAVIRADAYNLPLQDGCVDRMINIYNLEHMAYVDLALEEVHRVLSPDSYFFLSVPNEGVSPERWDVE